MDTKKLEHALFYLQELGLELNEYEKTNREMPIEDYKDLLSYTISLVRSVKEYSSSINKELTNQ
ncbi:hypothetical protein D0469_05905 [Peribacillus saganii]|uniref:Uncharacterized protein n=1 Tax=Peribacillus saganii TaxID=2303992 RepID=A0A372LRB5_9BACI|nr:hypothetical protein [Peribacillus saganii]RFU70467.1 hypothetical protein D0469_05905 [Peribacillus saganii]